MVFLVMSENKNQGAREPGRRAQAHEAEQIAISFIRTVTVGPGIAPGLLTSAPALRQHRALAGSRTCARIPPVGNFAPP